VIKKILYVALCVAAVAHGQVSSASLMGELRDESAAVIPGAQVTIRQESTGFTRSVVTGADGNYRADELLPGSYTVSASKAGFRGVTYPNVVVEVNQKARLDMVLPVGTGRDTLTVTGTVSRVAADDASAGFRMESKSIEALPMQGRSVASLVTLGPGAIPRQLGGFTHDVINDLQGNRGAVGLNAPINGARSTMNSYILDGAYNTDRNTFSVVIIPPLDAVQEFHIETSLMPAEFPQAAAAVDIVTKSGGQHFHGSAYEFFRNEATDARNLFDDPTLPRPIFRQNQFGGSIGGPAILPRTYFFAAYDGVRAKSATSTLHTLPDAALRGGNFQNQASIFDPLSLNAATGARLPFAGDTIPADRIDPIARTFLAKFEPLPNIPERGSSNYLDSTPNVNDNDNVTGRIDHQLGAHSWIFGRYSINDERGRLAGSFPQLPTVENLRAQQAAIGHTLAGNNWVNEARVSFTRLRVFDVPENAFTNDVIRQLGIQGFSTDPFNYGLPYFLVTNFDIVTDSTMLPQVQRDNTWEASDGFSRTSGRHSWKVGFDWVHFQLNYLQSQFPRGQYQFDGFFTQDPSSPNNTGDPFADFLLGFPQSTKRFTGDAQAYLRQNSYAAYVHDDFRVSNRLTLTMGVRYEYVSPYTGARNNLLNLDYSKLPAPPSLVRVSSAIDPDRNNFAPRIGMAWRLPALFHSPGETVFRAGYGIYFVPEIAVESYDLVRNGQNNQINETTGLTPILTLRDGFPQTSSTGFPSYYGVDPHARTPYMQQWTGSLQHEFANSILFELAYVGSKGTDLGRFRTFNTPAHIETGENLPPRPGDLQSLRTFPSLGPIFQRQHIANSSYNSLQIKAEKRFPGHISFLSSFVWSKSIDDADTVVPGQYDSIGAQDERNLRLERGLSFFNVGRRLSAGFVFETPDTRMLRSLLNHWQLSGVVTIQDGTPLNPVYFATDTANSGTPNRPNIVLGQNVSLPPSQRTTDHWFNTTAFSDPAPFTFGNAGRDTIPGPGNEVVDLAVHRRFRVREGASIEVRAESFNVLNYPNLGIPGPYPDFGPFFGKIFSTGQPRRMQFALRLDF